MFAMMSARPSLCLAIARAAECAVKGIMQWFWFAMFHDRNSLKCEFENQIRRHPALIAFHG